MCGLTSCHTGDRLQSIDSKLLFRSVQTTHLAYADVYPKPCYRVALNSRNVRRSEQSACSWTVFLPPLLPPALSFIIIKVRFMSESLGEGTLHFQSVRGPVKRWQCLPDEKQRFYFEKTWESFTWIRAVLMTRLTSSLHSETSGLWSSRFDEKASRWDRKYSAVEKRKFKFYLPLNAELQPSILPTNIYHLL